MGLGLILRIQAAVVAISLRFHSSWGRWGRLLVGCEDAKSIGGVSRVAGRTEEADRFEAVSTGAGREDRVRWAGDAVMYIKWYKK